MGEREREAEREREMERDRIAQEEAQKAREKARAEEVAREEERLREIEAQKAREAEIRKEKRAKMLEKKRLKNEEEGRLRKAENELIEKAKHEKFEVDKDLSGVDGYKNVWDPYDPTDNAVFWHVPKSGGTSFKTILGSCFRYVVASERGVINGHDKDTELAIVHPNARPGAESAAYVNVDPTTKPGIVRAREMGLAESGLADCIITPYFLEVNDIFSQKQGRLFALFRDPIERSISMFYYMQRAEWEPTFRPELRNWTLDDFARSNLVEENWLTRRLTNTLIGPLTEHHKNKALKIINSKFLVGLLSHYESSVNRFERFFKWTYKVNPMSQEMCRKEILESGKNAYTGVDHDTESMGDAFALLARKNTLDIQIYEFIEKLFVEQGNFVASIPQNFRTEHASCAKCVPPTFPFCKAGGNC